MPKKKIKTKSQKPVSKKKRQPGTDFYFRRLTQMRDDIFKTVHSRQSPDVTSMDVGDEADVASQSSERELQFELSDNERQSLDAIEAALRKIDQHRFGLCESCTKKIPRLRLKVMPQARYCVVCQSRFERPRL